MRISGMKCVPIKDRTPATLLGHHFSAKVSSFLTIIRRWFRRGGNECSLCTINVLLGKFPYFQRLFCFGMKKLFAGYAPTKLRYRSAEYLVTSLTETLSLMDSSTLSVCKRCSSGLL